MTERTAGAKAQGGARPHRFPESHHSFLYTEPPNPATSHWRLYTCACEMNVQKDATSRFSERGPLLGVGGGI